MSAGAVLLMLAVALGSDTPAMIPDDQVASQPQVQEELPLPVPVAAEPSLPTVVELVYCTASYCTPCRQVYPIICDLYQEGWPITVLQADQPQYKSLVDRWQIRLVPAYIGRDKDFNLVYRAEGIRTRDQLIAILQANGLRKGPPRPAQAASRQVSRLSGPSWSWEGDLRDHLVESHGHRVSGLDDYPLGDLVTIHDNAHNRDASASVMPQETRRVLSSVIVASPESYTPIYSIAPQPARYYTSPSWGSSFSSSGWGGFSGCSTGGS